MEAVCFDMDGVIVDSERHWAPLENERILPRAVPSADVGARDITGMNVTDLYAHLDGRFGTAIGEAEFVDLYDEAAEELYTERVRLLDGFHDLLDGLRDRDAGIALVSSSPPRWIRLVLDRFSLAGRFDAVVSASDIEGEGKPAPDVYRHAAGALELAPGRCVAVEDSRHGVEAAVRAGMYCLAYRTDANEGQDLSNADEVIEGAERLRIRLRSLCH